MLLNKCELCEIYREHFVKQEEIGEVWNGVIN